MLSCINKVGGGEGGFCGKVTAADHLCGLWRAVNRGVGPFLSRDSCSQGGRGGLSLETFIATERENPCFVLVHHQGSSAYFHEVLPQL